MMSEATDKAVDKAVDKATTVLADLIEKAAGGIDQAVAFSQAQIPDVVGQFLVWNATKSAILFSLSIIVIFICLLIFKHINSYATRFNDNVRQKKSAAIDDFENGKAWTRYGARKNQDLSSFEYDRVMSAKEISDDDVLWSKLTISALSLFLFLMLIDFDWLKIWLAPKLYLIEYAASLVK